MNALLVSFPAVFDPMGGWGSLFFLVFCFIMAGREVRGRHVKKNLPPDPHPQKYTYRSFMIEALLFILAVGALVFELGVMGYLS